jgi:hypothetical protein
VGNRRSCPRHLQCVVGEGGAPAVASTHINCVSAQCTSSSGRTLSLPQIVKRIRPAEALYRLTCIQYQVSIPPWELVSIKGLSRSSVI